MKKEIELEAPGSKRKLWIRVALVVTLIAIAISAFSYAIGNLISAETGYQTIECTASAANCSSEFVFTYNIGVSGISPTAELKAVTNLYNEKAAFYYRLFHPDEKFDDVVNVASLNTSPNVKMKIPEELYNCLEKAVADGTRSLFLGPVYAYYETLFSSSNDEDAATWDPAKNEDLAREYAETLAFASDSAHISVELKGGEATLRVSDEYLAFAKETVTMESREDLSYNYHKLGDIAGMQERLEEAREYYERSLEINHALVEETGTVESRQMLSVSYERLGVIAQAQGRLEKAKEYYEKSLEIRLALAKETGTAESRRGLSVIYEKLGDIAEVEGRLEEAKEYYEKTLEIRLALAIETGTIESRRDFSVSYEKLGDIAEVEGRLEEAKEYYEKSLESYLALTKETGTARSRRDLFLSYEKLGDTARAQERLEEAKEYYVKALEISLALVQETGTAESRRFLSHSYGRFGAIAEAQGRLEEAQKYYEKCLEIKLALAKETRTLQAYEDLQIICFNFGAFLFNSGTDIGRAKEMFQKVVQVGEEGGFPQLKKPADDAKEILSQYF